MNYQRNKFLSNILIFFIILTMFFWMIPGNMIFGEGDGGEQLTEATAEGQPVLTIEIILPQENFDEGSSFTYLLRLTNNGDGDAANVSLKSTLPENISYISDSLAGLYDSSINTVSWDFEAISPGESKSIEIQAGIPSVIADGDLKTITAMTSCDEIENVGSVSVSFTVNNIESTVEEEQNYEELTEGEKEPSI